MKIKETVERECCQRADLKPFLGRMAKFSEADKPMFCKHCGQIHLLKRRFEGGMPESEYRHEPITIGEA